MEMRKNIFYGNTIKNEVLSFKQFQVTTIKIHCRKNPSMLNITKSEMMKIMRHNATLKENDCTQ